MRPIFGGLPREVSVLTAVAVAVAVGFGVVAPAIPLFAREFGVGNTAAAAVVSAFALMRLVFALTSGRLVDRFGERVILAAGIGIVAVSSALAGLAQSYAQLLMLRGVGGVGSAMFTVSAMSLLLRVAGPEQRGRATGLFQAGFLVGAVTGPAIGGVVTRESVRSPFFLYAATLVVAGGIGLIYLAHTRLPERLDPAGVPERTTLGQALSSQAYRTALVAQLGTGWVLYGVRSSLLPLFVLDAMHRDPVWTGAGLVLSAAAQGALLVPAGRLADSAGRRPVLLAGAAIAAVGTGLLAVSATPAAYAVSMLLTGAGFAGLSPAASAVVGDVMSGRGGTVVAAYGMAGDLGAVVGPLVAGQLADSVSYGAAWGVSAGVVAAGFVMALAMPETRHAPAKPSLDRKGE